MKLTEMTTGKYEILCGTTHFAWFDDLTKARKAIDMYLSSRPSQTYNFTLRETNGNILTQGTSEKGKGPSIGPKK